MCWHRNSFFFVERFNPKIFLLPLRLAISCSSFLTLDDILSKASETLRNHPLPAFDVVENLVEEEVCNPKHFSRFCLSPASILLVGVALWQ